MNFDSPEVEKDFPGIYQGEGDDDNDKGLKKRKKKKDKDKGYALFEEEESDQEEMQLVSTTHHHHHHHLADDLKSPGSKLKKNKPSFRFPTKLAKDKEKNEKEQKRKEKLEKEKERQEKEKEKLEKEKAEKQEKVTKKMEKERKKKKKHSSSAAGGRLGRLAAADVVKDEAEDRAVFGVSLEVAIERSRLPDGILLPRVFRECIDDVEERGLQQQGIYRISGVKSKVQKLKDAYNRGKPVYLPDYDPHISSTLFKLFLRELPEPVLTPALNSKFDEACALPDEKSRIERFVVLVDQLPQLNKVLLAWTIVHMVHVIEHEKVNKMSLENVSIVLSPTMKISHRVLNVFFSHSRVFFEEDTVKKFVPTIRQDASRMSLEVPETTASIEEELKRQQTILDKLHDELLAGVSDRTKEEELWEVQRVVTTLKRKLRQMKKEDATAASAAATEEEEEPAGTGTGVDGFDHDADAEEAEAAEGEMEVGKNVEEAAEKTVEVVAAVVEEAEKKRDGSETPKVEKSEEATLTTMAPPSEEEEEAAVPEEAEAETDEDYVDMGHDEGYKALVEALLEEEQKLVLETEELNQLGEELRRKIESEKSEIERLREEMEEIRLRRAQSLEDVEMLQRQAQQPPQQDGEGGVDQTDAAAANTHGVATPATALTASTGSDIESNFSGGSGSESELDEEELHQLLQSLVKETDHLFREKQNITIQIETERTKCMNYKIQIRLMQWRTERLMTLQQKQDEKLLRDKPLMPVAASTFQQQQQQQPQPGTNHSVAVEATDGDGGGEKDTIDLKDVEKDFSVDVVVVEAKGEVKMEDLDDIVVNGDLKSEDASDGAVDDETRSSPLEITQF